MACFVIPTQQVVLEFAIPRLKERGMANSNIALRGRGNLFEFRPQVPLSLGRELH